MYRIHNNNTLQGSAKTKGQNRPPDLDNSKKPDRVVSMYILLMDNTKRIVDQHNIIVNSNTTRRRYLISYIIV